MCVDVCKEINTQKNEMEWTQGMAEGCNLTEKFVRKTIQTVERIY